MQDAIIDVFSSNVFILDLFLLHALDVTTVAETRPACDRTSYSGTGKHGPENRSSMKTNEVALYQERWQAE